MAQVVFQQGEDVIIELPITVAGLPVDLSSATSLRVQLYITKNNVKTLAKQYSSTPKSGYGTCRVKTGLGNENIIEILVKRSESISFEIGVISFAVITTFSSVDFPDGKNTEYDFNSYGTVQEGEAKDEIIP